MRILITGFTENRGGIEKFVMNYIKAMKKNGFNFEFDILGYTPHPAFEEEIRRYGGEIYVVSSPRHPDSHKKLNEFFAKYAKSYDMLWCNKCDLANIDFLLAAKRYGIPKRILHSHSSSNMHQGVKGHIFELLHRIHRAEIDKLATEFWACSDLAAKWLFPKRVIAENRVRYIPNAINVSAFAFSQQERDAYRKQLGLGSAVTYGCVGRLSTVKNTAFAIGVFYELWQINSNSKLLIVGSGELESQLKEQAEKLLCSDHILFLGMRKDVPGLMQAMDCYLMPSLFEGFPVSAVEAQAAGLPVFAASDGITEQVKLTPLCHLLPLAVGVGKWAQEIQATDLTRKDYAESISEKGFDISVAAKRMWEYLIQ